MSWPLVALKDCCTVVGGATPKREVEAYWDNQDILWVTPKDISKIKSIYFDDAPEYISQKGFDSCAAHKLPKGSLLLTSRAPIGNVAITTRELCTNQGFKSLVPKENVDIKYLYFCMLYSVGRLENEGNGATFKEVSKKVVEAFKIPLPPLETQKQIAAVLEKADQLRKDCQQMEQELNSLAQSVFIEMFGDVTEEEDLSNHLEFITSGSRGWAKYYSNSGRRFIRSLDVQMNHIGEVDIAYVQPPNGKETERTKVQSGDVLLTITGSRIGRVSWVPQDFGDAHISQHVALLRLKGSLLPEFLSYFMSLEGYGQRQIAKSQYGQTKPGLKLDHIKAFSIPKITLEKQQEFVDYMYKLTLIISDNKKQLKEINFNFNALMQKAFKGELTL